MQVTIPSGKTVTIPSGSLTRSPTTNGVDYKGYNIRPIAGGGYDVYSPLGTLYTIPQGGDPDYYVGGLKPPPPVTRQSQLLHLLPGSTPATGGGVYYEDYYIVPSDGKLSKKTDKVAIASYKLGRIAGRIASIEYTIADKAPDKVATLSNNYGAYRNYSKISTIADKVATITRYGPYTVYMNGVGYLGDVYIVPSKVYPGALQALEVPGTTPGVQEQEKTGFFHKMGRAITYPERKLTKTTKNMVNTERKIFLHPKNELSDVKKIATHPKKDFTSLVPGESLLASIKKNGFKGTVKDIAQNPRKIAYGTLVKGQSKEAMYDLLFL